MRYFSETHGKDHRMESSPLASSNPPYDVHNMRKNIASQHEDKYSFYYDVPQHSKNYLDPLATALLCLSIVWKDFLYEASWSNTMQKSDELFQYHPPSTNMTNIL